MDEHQDPTEEFLAGVRAEETPWRVDRVEHLPPEPIVPEPAKWRRTRAVAQAAGRAAPYVNTAATVGWLATEAAADDDPGYDDPGFQDPGFQLDGTAGI